MKTTLTQKKILELFMADQRDRSLRKVKSYNNRIAIREWKKRDRARQTALLRILKNKNLKLTGNDYFMAGIIFQHGTTIASLRKAVAMAKKGAALNNDAAKWLYAAATDRLLVRQKKKQKFGTQYYKNSKTGKWLFYPVDPKTTDKERERYNVVTLKEARENVRIWNREGKDPWKYKRKTAGITSRK